MYLLNIPAYLAALYLPIHLHIYLPTWSHPCNIIYNLYLCTYLIPAFPDALDHATHSHTTFRPAHPLHMSPHVVYPFTHCTSVHPDALYLRTHSPTYHDGPSMSAWCFHFSKCDLIIRGVASSVWGLLIRKSSHVTQDKQHLTYSWPARHTSSNLLLTCKAHNI